MNKKVSQKKVKDIVLNEDNFEVESLSKNIDQTPKSDVVFKILFGNPKHVTKEKKLNNKKYKIRESKFKFSTKNIDTIVPSPLNPILKPIPLVLIKIGYISDVMTYIIK